MATIYFNARWITSRNNDIPLWWCSGIALPCFCTATNQTFGYDIRFKAKESKKEKKKEKKRTVRAGVYIQTTVIESRQGLLNKGRRLADLSLLKLYNVSNR